VVEAAVATAVVVVEELNTVVVVDCVAKEDENE
jgi:hypothetical protein